MEYGVPAKKLPINTTMVSTDEDAHCPQCKTVFTGHTVHYLGVQYHPRCFVILYQRGEIKEGGGKVVSTKRAIGLP